MNAAVMNGTVQYVVAYLWDTGTLTLPSDSHWTDSSRVRLNTRG